MEELPEKSRAVQKVLDDAGCVGRIRVLTEPTPTAASAAEVVGCEVGAIANSLVFDADGEPLLVMTSGRHRVDTRLLAAELGRARIRRATPEFVRAATGQVIGGVAPVGHPGRLECVIDVALAEYPELWVAGGTPHTLVPLTYAELLRITEGREMTVAPD